MDLIRVERDSSTIGQRKKLSCDVVSRASADPLESAETGMTFQKCSEFRQVAGSLYTMLVIGYRPL